MRRGGRFTSTKGGGTERVFVIFLVHVWQKNLQQSKVALNRIDTCVLYKVPDSCSPILLKVPTLWGSFEIKNVRLAKIMLRQLSG